MRKQKPKPVYEHGNGRRATRYRAMREGTRPEVRETQHQYTNDFQRGECDIKMNN